MSIAKKETPEQRLQRRKTYKKWLEKPGVKERLRAQQKKATKKWLAKSGSVEKQRQACRNWRAKNIEYAREMTRQNMRQVRTTPEGLAKNRANSKKYQAIALRDNPEKFRRQHRNYKLMSNYGITVDQWDEIFVAQGKCCAICKSPHARWKRGHWHTDHDHNTNMIRGILCNECNIGIGKFKDNPALLQVALDYLQQGDNV